MEIYQAIDELLDINDSGHEGFEPWLIRPDINGEGYIVARKYTPSLNQYYASVDVPQSHLVYIEKKRGGIRVFKSLDAACNAVREIGQLQVEVIL